MAPGRYIPTSDAWINQIFNSRQARTFGVVRRSREDVVRYASIHALRREVERRGFHMIRTGNQYVILCHDGVVSIVC
jgi:hypothetical protein